MIRWNKSVRSSSTSLISPSISSSVIFFLACPVSPVLRMCFRRSILRSQMMRERISLRNHQNTNLGYDLRLHLPPLDEFPLVLPSNCSRRDTGHIFCALGTDRTCSAYTGCICRPQHFPSKCIWVKDMYENRPTLERERYSLFKYTAYSGE